MPFPLATLPVLIALPLLFSGLQAPAFMDHEGRYAEVAREMLLIGDWTTPYLNFTVFLNKPPLPYWLTALTFLLTGPSELARLWPAMTGLCVLLMTIALGCILAGRRVGLYAGWVLLSSGGFFLESRLLRPDLLLTLLLCLALLGGIKLLQTATRTRQGWLLLSAASLGGSILTKGMVDVVLVGAIFGGVLFVRGQPHFLKQLRWLPAILLMLAIVLPWHVLAGLRNEGFWWDYIVNQHLLFFFDKKFPRDSLPDSLSVFWAAFLGRLFPWSVFVPPALVWAIRKAWVERSPETLLAPVWIGVVMGFFSLSPSRLEHYAIPTLPAAALLVGWWWADVETRLAQKRRVVLITLILFALGGLLGFVASPALLAAEDWTKAFPMLVRLAHVVCGVACITASLAALAMWRHRPVLAFVAIACTALPLSLCIYRALITIEPVNSWKPVGMRLARLLPPDGEAIFAASDEYQICGGLNFYSGKSLSIFLPDGYIPPTYLTAGQPGAFLTRAEFFARWRSDRPTILVIDADRQEADPALFASLPQMKLGCWGARRMVANRAFAEQTSLVADSEHDCFSP